MGRITVYGASDDLVEVDGDVREEFGFSSSDEEKVGTLVAVSCGTLLRVRYDGRWRISVEYPGDAHVTHVAATDDEDDYSDRVTVETPEAPIRWVACRSEVAWPSKARSALDEKVVAALRAELKDGVASGNVDDGDLRAAALAAIRVVRSEPRR